MEKIWTKHWPSTVDEAAIRFSDQPLSALLSLQAERVQDRPALIFYGQELSFRELDAAVSRFAGWLLQRGIQPGDRVALFLENSPQFAIAYYGTLRAGGIAVCLNPMHKAAELLHEFSDSGARVLVTSQRGYATVAPIRNQSSLEAVAVTAYRDFLPDQPTLTPPPDFLEPATTTADTEAFLEIVRDAPPFAGQVPRAPGDTALLQYTSGTTGTPKAAEITHRNLVANCELQRVYIGTDDTDTTLGVLPWFHITGMECQMNMMAYMGGTLVAIGRFDLVTVLRAIERYRCKRTTLITTANIAIVNYPQARDFDLSSLRNCFSGGAPVPVEVARRWEGLTGYPLVEGYGLSETTAPTHINPPHRPKYGTIGLPLPLTDARIVSSEDGTMELGIGQTGEIAVRGPQVMKGYWGNPSATKEAFRDGWFLTGDIGPVDEEGYFTVVERKKDMIKVSGYSVFPAEVESLMYRHPAIAEAAVVGVPHPYRGEDPVAFVVLKPEGRGKLGEDQLAAWCRQEMSVYKAPRVIRFVDALPKTATGKILRRVLREKAAPTGAPKP